MGIAEEVEVWRLGSPDGESKEGKAFPEEMFSQAFLTSYSEFRATAVVVVVLYWVAGRDDVYGL